EDSGAGIAQLEDAAHDVDRCADVESARGVQRNQYAWTAADFPRQQDLLLVSAGERARPRIETGAAHVERFQKMRGAASMRLEIDPQSANPPRLLRTVA